jgi:hypothetical protein
MSQTVEAHLGEILHTGNRQSPDFRDRRAVMVAEDERVGGSLSKAEFHPQFELLAAMLDKHGDAMAGTLPPCMDSLPQT